MRSPKPLGGNPPTYEVGVESKLAWLEGLASLPGKSTLENVGTETAAGVVVYQHPDHDTDAGWKSGK